MFADRLELYSPGELANTMTPDTLSYRQAKRNESITSLLAKCRVTESISGLRSTRSRLMDRRGEGVPLILEQRGAFWSETSLRDHRWGGVAPHDLWGHCGSALSNRPSRGLGRAIGGASAQAGAGRSALREAPSLLRSVPCDTWRQNPAAARSKGRWSTIPVLIALSESWWRQVLSWTSSPLVWGYRFPCEIDSWPSGLATLRTASRKRWHPIALAGQVFRIPWVWTWGRTRQNVTRGHASFTCPPVKCDCGKQRTTSSPRPP